MSEEAVNREVMGLWGLMLGLGNQLTLQHVSPSAEELPGKDFSGNMVGNGEKGPRVKDTLYFAREFQFCPLETWKPRKHFDQQVACLDFIFKRTLEEPSLRWRKGIADVGS